LVNGPDGNIWFLSYGLQSGISLVGQIDLHNGDTVKTSNTGLIGGHFWTMGVGSDHNIWFTEQQDLDGGSSPGMTFGVINPTTARTVNGSFNVTIYDGYPNSLTPDNSRISALLDAGSGSFWTLDTSYGRIGKVTFK